jgi:hypothetical protein
LPYGSYGWAGSTANNAVGATAGSFDEAGAGASSAQQGGGGDKLVGEIDRQRPKNDEIVVCGNKGMPGCGAAGKLDDLDKLALRNSDEVRDATLGSKQEYGKAFKETSSGFYDVATDKQGNELQTSGQNGKIRMGYVLERGETYVGDIHGHPSGSGSEYFSGYDINHTPAGTRAYLVTPENAVLRFDSASNTITVIQSPRSMTPGLNW